VFISIRSIAFAEGLGNDPFNCVDVGYLHGFLRREGYSSGLGVSPSKGSGRLTFLRGVEEDGPGSGSDLIETGEGPDMVLMCRRCIASQVSKTRPYVVG
jgi:hypothetical protein